MSDKSIQGLIEEISSTNNRDHLLEAVRRFMRVFGFLGFAIGALPAAGEPASFYLASFPEEWPEFAGNWARAFDGPCVRAAMHGPCPFTSDELSPPSTEMRVALAAAGGPPRQALIVPIHNPGWGIGWASFIAPAIALTTDERVTVLPFSVYAFERAKALAEAPAPAEGTVPVPPLTAREQQCLECVASGLSDAQIAENLGISWSTAHYHVEHVRRKLGARNRAHAVALAMRSRLV